MKEPLEIGVLIVVMVITILLVTTVLLLLFGSEAEGATLHVLTGMSSSRNWRVDCKGQTQAVESDSLGVLTFATTDCFVVTLSINEEELRCRILVESRR